MLPSNRTFVFLSIAAFASIFLLPLFARAVFGDDAPQPVLVGTVLFGFVAFVCCILPLLIRVLFGIAQRLGILGRFVAASGQGSVDPAVARRGADLATLVVWAIWLAGIGIAAAGLLGFSVA